MENAELKAEADLLILACRLPELLAVYPSWFIGGSYSYDLMCWRDLDVYVLDPMHDLKQCFEVGYELTLRLTAKKSFFTNNVAGEPSGLYWGIRLGKRSARGVEAGCLVFRPVGLRTARIVFVQYA